MGGSAKRYPLRSSCLYKVATKRDLARLLQSDLGFLRSQTRCEKPYLEFSVDGRNIQEPKPGLKAVQARFARLLSAIETPEYVHSGVKKRSYVTNAVAHAGSSRLMKLDIKRFFQSVRAQEVFDFLHNVLKWPVDVAQLGTGLLTFRGHLPTGGNASPILSFWVHKSMFDEVAEVAEQAGCVFTLYIDDMTISGELAPRRLQFAVRRIVGRRRLRVHKLKLFGRGQDRVVTGVALTSLGVRLPMVRQKLIWEANRRLGGLRHAEKGDAFRALIGRLSEGEHVDANRWARHTRKVVEEYRTYRTEMARQRWEVPHARAGKLAIPEEGGKRSRPRLVWSQDQTGLAR